MTVVHVHLIGAKITAGKAPGKPVRNYVDREPLRMSVRDYLDQ